MDLKILKPLPGFLVKRYKGWKATTFQENKSLYKKLAKEGQNPKAMIISCCDSRVHVTSIFGSEAGEFFIHRNIANLVPPYRSSSDYHGTSVSELTKLREEARNSSVHLKVIRNTLAKKALIDTKFSCFEDLLVGPTILAFSLDDPTNAPKLANNFTKLNSNFKVKGLSMGESLLDLGRLSDIANLPTKEEAVAQFLGLLNAPISKLVSLANEIPTKLTRTMLAIKQAKEEQNS